MKPTEAVDVSGFVRLLGLEQPLSGQEIGALYAFIGEHPPLHDIVVELRGGAASLEAFVPAWLERVRLASKLSPEEFRTTLITMIRAFIFTPKVAAEPQAKPTARRPRGAAPAEPEAEAPPTKPRRKYRRRGQAKAKRAKQRPAAQSVGEKVPLPEKVRTLISLAKKRGEKPKQTLQRLLDEHPGPRGFCEFANPIMRRVDIKGFSPGQYHQLAGFDFRGWRA